MAEMQKLLQVLNEPAVVSGIIPAGGFFKVTAAIGGMQLRSVSLQEREEKATTTVQYTPGSHAPPVLHIA